MKKIHHIIIAGIVLLTANLAFSEEFKFTGQVRQRAEFDNKDFDSGSNASNTNYLRTRLGFLFAPEDDLGIFIQLQDSRGFGEETSTLDGSAGNFDMHQAYVRVYNIFNQPLTLKLGRFEAAFGNQRLIGAVGWSNIGRSFDGGVLTHETDKLKTDFFGFDEELKTTYGIYSNYKAPFCESIDGFVILEDHQVDDELRRYTAGLFLKGKLDNAHYEAEFAYQGGTFNLGTAESDIAAMMFGVNMGYSFLLMEKDHDITVGMDYLSGDDNPADSEDKAFNTLYATNHKFYGFMDYFPSGSGSAGLMDIYAKISANLTPKITTKLDYHLFNSAEDYTLSAGSTGTNYGSEIDLTAAYKYTEKLTLTAGASFFMPGEIFEVIQGEDTASWFYLMTTVSF